MTHTKDLLAALLGSSLLLFLPGCATSPTNVELGTHDYGASPRSPEAKVQKGAESGPGGSQLWLSIEQVELTITARVRLVISVDGVPSISYPARQDWSDGRTSERFPLPMGRSGYTFRFEGTLFDGTRTIPANASESFTLDRSKLPITSQAIRLYPTDSSTWGRGAIARVSFSVGDGGRPQESVPTPPTTVEEIVDRLEVQWDAHDLDLGQTFPSWNNWDADVAIANAELALRLTTRPHDTQTLLLWARFNLAGYRSDSLIAPEDALDLVLATEPHNAEALYYKGRLYGRPTQVGGQSRKRTDLVRAVSFLRQAVQFAPNKLKYQKALAVLLADQGHVSEAKLTLSAAPRNDPLIRLLEELEPVPIPEGAEYFFDHPLWGAYMLALLDSGVLDDYLHLRMRLYRISKSPAEIGAFYAARIPDFRFIPINRNTQDASNGESESEVRFVQFLRMKSGTMRPSLDLMDIPDPQEREPGIHILLFEMRNDPELGRTLGPNENNCYLLLVNSRK